ncbi:MAG: EscU/YscU/HrcU family type III secretion system export apparatus switch protein, partial [Planctomycetaceae bacterium]|nr:EscU/YscU/HrcU family type III secretion system export apparatus switch protein [Planctomycetaceae bacterium]
RAQGTQDADVVVANPTHLSIGIKYDMQTMAYPVVVSKGADHLAFTIRKIAAEHGIPVVTRVPLAWELFEKVDIGQPVNPKVFNISEEHMETLAEVISYAYWLTGRGRTRRQTG